MASDKFKVRGLADVRLSSDGKEVHLIFETAQRTKLTLVVPGWDMKNLSYLMMQFDRQAQIKRELPPDADRPMLTIDAPPPMLLVSEMAGVVRPDSGSLDLQFRDVMKHEVQICLLPAHVSYLFDLLLQVQKSDDDQKPN